MSTEFALWFDKSTTFKKQLLSTNKWDAENSYRWEELA